MKKFLLILMCVCMILSIVGCGNSDKKVNTPEPQKTEQASPTNSTSQTTAPTAEPTDEPEYDNVAYVAGKKIYVNYKMDVVKTKNIHLLYFIAITQRWFHWFTIKEILLTAI